MEKNKEPERPAVEKGYVKEHKVIGGMVFAGIILFIISIAAFVKIYYSSLSVEEIMVLTVYSTIILIFSGGLIVGGLRGKEKKLPVYEYIKGEKK